MVEEVDSVVQKESRPSSEGEVISFLNKVWNHPLLNEMTIKHRERFGERFREWCKPWKIDEKAVVAVLCGSSLWVTDKSGSPDEFGHAEGSDWDFTLYGSKQVISSYRKEREEVRSKYDVHSELKYEDWNTHPVKVYDDSQLTRVGVLAPLLLAPDNLIAGNIDLAHRYRMALLKIKNPKPSEIEDYYNRYMKGWPEKESRSGIGDRKTRFKRVLRQKAREVYKGILIVGLEEYEQRLLSLLSNIELPALESFEQAVEMTKGKFVLSGDKGGEIK